MRLASVLMLFITLPALACPNLSGAYKSCKTLGKVDEVNQMSVEQKILNRYNQYTFKVQEADSEVEREEVYLADGKIRTNSETDSDTGITMKTTTQANCSGDVLTVRVSAKIDSQEFASVIIETRKNGAELVQIFSGTSMGEPVNETVICN